MFWPLDERPESCTDATPAGMPAGVAPRVTEVPNSSTTWMSQSPPVQVPPEAPRSSRTVLPEMSSTTGMSSSSMPAPVPVFDLSTHVFEEPMLPPMGSVAGSGALHGP